VADTPVKSSANGSPAGDSDDTGEGATGAQHRHDPLRRRTAILHSAELEFARHGYGSAKVASIAKRAGYPLSVVYRTFPAGKIQIWNELNDDRFNELVTFVLPNGWAQLPPARRMLDSIRAAYIFMCRHPNFLELHLREGFSWATAADSGRGSQRRSWAAAVDIFVDMAAAEGGVATPSDFSAARVARLAISIVQVWLHEWWHSPRESDIEEDAERLVSFLSLWLRDES